MVRPAKRSRSLRKIFYRTPGGKTKVRYKRRKTTKARCGVCKKTLQGISTSRKLPKSRKRHGRPFAGALCLQCSEEVFKLKARIEDKSLKLRDVEIRYRPYVEQMVKKE